MRPRTRWFQKLFLFHKWIINFLQGWVNHAVLNVNFSEQRKSRRLLSQYFQKLYCVVHVQDQAESCFHAFVHLRALLLPCWWINTNNNNAKCETSWATNDWWLMLFFCQMLAYVWVCMHHCDNWPQRSCVLAWLSYPPDTDQITDRCHQCCRYSRPRGELTHFYSWSLAVRSTSAWCGWHCRVPAF